MATSALRTSPGQLRPGLASVRAGAAAPPPGSSRVGNRPRPRNEAAAAASSGASITPTLRSPSKLSAWYSNSMR